MSAKLLKLVSTEPYTLMNEGDFSDFNSKSDKAAFGFNQSINPQTCAMRFNHGILNLDQLLPIHLMGSSFALDVELCLSKPEDCSEIIDAQGFGTVSYEYSNVSYNIKLLKLDNQVI